MQDKLIYEGRARMGLTTRLILVVLLLGICIVLAMILGPISAQSDTANTILCLMWIFFLIATPAILFYDQSVPGNVKIVNVYQQGTGQAIVPQKQIITQGFAQNAEVFALVVAERQAQQEYAREMLVYEAQLNAYYMNRQEAAHERELERQAQQYEAQLERQERSHEKAMDVISQMYNRLADITKTFIDTRFEKMSELEQKALLRLIKDNTLDIEFRQIPLDNSVINGEYREITVMNNEGVVYAPMLIGLEDGREIANLTPRQAEVFFAMRKGEALELPSPKETLARLGA